ncbi:VCBS repeat-containing protein [Dyadobacter subterraneus]|uniref:VCBS repeat-containing protein n=1 Tax=Dyadobacter subterraneus TaxID=2773304 RepID=A0ABR9WIP1_9BACT|nr:VCBS repeat-containing protein [Dyadobacter subterraneus]MBE9465258.1 VCBS repeat-containing protein [Dyadobacter subterraneus]
MIRKLILLSIISITLFTCKKKNQDTLFELLPSKETGITFSNELKEDEKLNILTYEYFYNGGGVGVGDINNDGLQDVFMGGNMSESRLYLNKGNLKFEDITEKSGISLADSWARGISMVDINADGFLDIYVCRAGPQNLNSNLTPRPNLLYINKGNNTFFEEAKKYGLDYSGNTTQAAFFDYDKDGDLDVFLVTNVMERKGPNVIRPKRTDGSALSTDKLYRNDGKINGQIKFTNVSAEANILTEGFGLGVSIVDVNEDGWPDVYVSNDYLSNDLLYINQQNGSFKNEITDYFRHQSYSAMGNDAADIDNDGLVDFVTLDMLPEGNIRRKNMFGLMNYDRFLSEQRMGYQPQFMRNTLQHNNGNRPGTNHPFFSEVGRFSGVQATDWSWGALFADYDNDGKRDLMVTNGYPKDITNRDFVIYRMAQYQQQIQSGNLDNAPTVQALKEVEGAHVANYLFKNNGNLTFKNESESWGFDTPSFSNGAAYADLDNDGDLDLIINNIDHEAFVYKNHSEKLPDHHYLRIKLNGTKDNPYGFGVKVTIYTKNEKQFIEHSPYRGYQSTVENTLHFGLGKSKKIDSIRVIWPDKKTQLLTNISSDQVLKVEYNKAANAQKINSIIPKPIFQEVSDALGIHYTHKEELYIDFKVQPLLPHLLSQNGPGIAVGDINEDGLEDFYVGGAFKHSGSFFIQNGLGKFIGKPLTKEQKFEEDMGTLLFDSDLDGDLDLYIVSGSSEFPIDSKYYQDRLYLNDGKGNFKLDTSALPINTTSGSSVSAIDFDRDGDLDLFIGGRLTPGQYPTSPKSSILRNDHGKFTDITAQICPELKNIGMVTTSLWTDFDNDGWMDLILGGEWMPLTFLKNTNGKLVNVTSTTGLTNTNGWWNSLVAGDFDEDGDMDYVAGNVGLNSEERPSATKPLTMFAKDFDKSGTMDPVMFRYSGENLYPIHPRDEMTSQMNFLKKRFVYYGDYAKAEMKDIFTKDELKDAKKLSCEEMRSVFIENLGNGKFKIKALSIAAQLGPVYGIVVGDYNADGHLDLLMTGNSYAPESISGRLDAFNGLLLQGNGKGNFVPISPANSGFLAEGDGKGLAELTLNNGGRLILAAQNNDILKTFQSQKPEKDFVKINPLANDSWAEITLKNSQKRRHEWNYGAGYLSQSSRILVLPKENISNIKIYNSKGTSRIINISKLK